MTDVGGWLGDEELISFTFKFDDEKYTAQKITHIVVALPHRAQRRTLGGQTGIYPTPDLHYFWAMNNGHISPEPPSMLVPYVTCKIDPDMSFMKSKERDYLEVTIRELEPVHHRRVRSPCVCHESNGCVKRFHGSFLEIFSLVTGHKDEPTYFLYTR
ncbi:hypothetical protein BT69DRAFT_1296505 [Atractiella rhizophila]|nr:hypothetical protein BT69DRAFT_1296505 [Atractiella rhizophila]